jgi:hypothetical protein
MLAAGAQLARGSLVNFFLLQPHTSSVTRVVQLCKYAMCWHWSGWGDGGCLRKGLALLGLRRCAALIINANQC